MVLTALLTFTYSSSSNRWHHLPLCYNMQHSFPSKSKSKSCNQSVTCMVHTQILEAFFTNLQARMQVVYDKEKRMTHPQWTWALSQSFSFFVFLPQFCMYLISLSYLDCPRFKRFISVDTLQNGAARTLGETQITSSPALKKTEVCERQQRTVVKESFQKHTCAHVPSSAT